MWQLLLAQAGMQAGQSLMGGFRQQATVKAQNAAKSEANLRTILESAETVNSFNRQGLELRRRAVDLQRSAQQATVSTAGSARTMQAQSGLTGASVDAVLDNINRELALAETGIEVNQETAQYNLITRLKSSLSASEQALHRLSPEMSDTEVFINAGMAGMMSAGQMYAQSYFQFEAGKAGG